MEEKFSYNKYKFLEKLYTPVGIILAGFLLQFFYPGVGFYQRLLIYLIYLSGALLFIFDTLPVIINTYKSWNKEIVLTNRTIIVKGDNHLQTRVISRQDINKIIFRSLRGEDLEIPHQQKLEKIDEKLYELSGGKFIVDYDSETMADNLTIYLELLPVEFVEIFINWYQADIALK
ncbi:hypothetical protein [Halanaerobium salsuginis]|jgi:hypothetical protein|uniref:PH domain-containing protein n=1 Tax=Halanaerobium salsuginis TaxID=29563 RepID=A0A1I4N4R3_9FIRM|nr:hypothetical protein [Halanaerobium salsuginis]SFM10263.1 hypothetical protein SAMN02983006_02805 [Halanaerobium salsuginis]